MGLNQQQIIERLELIAIYAPDMLAWLKRDKNIPSELLARMLPQINEIATCEDENDFRAMQQLMTYAIAMTSGNMAGIRLENGKIYPIYKEDIDNANTKDM